MTWIKYIGYAVDRFGALKAHKTRRYSNDYEAHKAAEKLCKKYFGARGMVRVESIKIIYL